MTRSTTLRAALAAVVPMLLAASASAASTDPGEPGAGWEIADITPIDVDGVPVSLSPDGAFLAGTAERGKVCIWSVADLAATCTDELRAVDPGSISWAPDSSAVAFSALAFLYLVDSDIHVFDVAGSLANVTDDGFDARLEIDDDPTDPAVPVDVMPAWTPDSTAIVFSRAVWNDEAQREWTDIMTVSRDGGEPALLHRVDRRTAIYTAMRVLSDGAVVYTAAPIDPADELHGIWRLDTDGTNTRIIAGDRSAPFPVPVTASVWEGAAGLAVSGFSLMNAAAFGARGNVAFHWSTTSGGPNPLAAVTTDESAAPLSAVISPDGGSILQLVLAGGAALVEVVGPTTSSTALPEGESSSEGGPPRHPIPTWAGNGTVFVPALGRAAPSILSMSPTGAGPTTTG